MTFDITNAEKQRILELYNVRRDVNILKERIRSCQFSKDGKYILFENEVYDAETGDLSPLTEAWTASDIGHTAADILSVGADFIVPGSGALIDTLNGIAYMVEAHYERDPYKSSMLYLMAGVTFAFAAVPGPLQASAIPLKSFLKTGLGKGGTLAMKLMPAPLKAGLKLVQRLIPTITTKIGPMITKALKSRLASKLTKGLGPRLGGIIENGLKKIGTSFDNIIGTKGLKTLEKTQKSAYNAIRKATLYPAEKRTMKTFFSTLRNVRRGDVALKKLGFKPGKMYNFILKKGDPAKTFKIIGIDDKMVKLMPISKSGKVVGKMVNGKMSFNPVTLSMSDFIRASVGFPWLRKIGNNAIPLFVKHFSRMLVPDGSDFDYEAINNAETLDPDQTSMESLAYLRDEMVADYQGDKGNYTVNPTVQAFQNALLLLGYPLPRAGADGKFGPETREQLKRFQADNYLDNSEGKMNRLTADKLALELKTRGIPNSEDLQNTLNNL